MLERARQDDWKLKYRELLREFETKEREWEKLEAALRRAASQLAIAAMGQGPQLDAQVEKVVKLTRPGMDTGELGNSLHELSATLKQVEIEVTGMQKALSEPVETLDSRMSKLIGGLLERLTALPALAGDATELALLQKSSETTGDWSELLDGLADRVAAAIETLRTQRVELERFLEQVQQQLGQFEAFAQWQHDDAKSRERSSAELESTMQVEMRGLREEAANSPNLNELKLKVQMRLDTVGSRLLDYRQEEARRLAEAEQRNETLNGELESLRGKMQKMQQVVGRQQQHLMLDALTQVHSRYAYDQRVEEERQRALRHGQKLAYVLCDIDRFKAINDNFGHAAGDRLLQAVGKMFQDSKRTEDFFARIGGEEFVLLLPMTGAAEALAIADRLREQLAGMRFHHSGRPTQVTVSCGVTEFLADDTSASLYERADRALYEAKAQGRNCCIVA
jgi:diguanylate cyclase